MQEKLESDLNEYNPIKGAQLKFIDENDKSRFVVILRPYEGPYEGGKYVFEVKIPDSYPHDSPKVHLMTPIYHPNITLNGNISLNILDDWKPIYTLNELIMALLFLMIEINPYDTYPNKDLEPNIQAGRFYLDNKQAYLDLVKRTMMGGFISELKFTFPCVLRWNIQNHPSFDEDTKKMVFSFFLFVNWSKSRTFKLPKPICLIILDLVINDT
eukprot:TRINITY_DN10206_c0_g1_i1.p1 TRINITY_DN10206_c0_g1~~TRINITY_DN10206_c0_g1_i1.p1  ORF type:complete len:245 (+),score=35.19 TRINITY_DN10206_c0_g1_i1:98-736(+)